MKTDTGKVNTLYYGDNLDVLPRHIPDESVDLIYLDPPFNSNADYNVLFAERDGTRAHAQFKAFTDTWTWDVEAARSFQETVERGGQVAQSLVAFKTLMGTSDMLAYLSMMAPRLVELRRVLKATGSIYLHCDPTASHYLKVLMDGIFGPQNFLNEVVWKRTFAHGSTRRWGPVHDILLFYSKTGQYRWRTVTQPYDEAYLTSKYRHEDERGRYRLVVLTAPGVRHGDSGKPWDGYDPTKIGRHWAVPRVLMRGILEGDPPAAMTIQEQLTLLSSNGLVRRAVKKGGARGAPEFKQYLAQGMAVQDVITDIPPINSQAQERLGYPTQKPEALLERIIEASSNDGDVVLDPFCGCGTAVAVAQRLGRRWLGIDITHLAINLIKVRLRDAFGDVAAKTYRVIGEPVDVESARQLAVEDPYQFQWWALGLVGARPVEQKKGADRGIDGRLFFHDESEAGQVKQVVMSVKAGGGLHVSMVRDLVGVLTREASSGAVMAVLISMVEPTKPMRVEAAGAGFYRSPGGTQHPKVQILTIQELFDGGRIDMPAWRDIRTFKRAPRSRVKFDEPGLPFKS